MRVVVPTDYGVLELNYMWLPTWIGMNAKLQEELQTELSQRLVGLPLSPELVDEAHRSVLEFLSRRFPAIEGLYEYLDGLKFVNVNEQG